MRQACALLIRVCVIVEVDGSSEGIGSVWLCGCGLCGCGLCGCGLCVVSGSVGGERQWLESECSGES